MSVAYTERMQVPMLVFDHVKKTVATIQAGDSRDIFPSKRLQVASSGRLKK